MQKGKDELAGSTVNRSTSKQVVLQYRQKGKDLANRKYCKQKDKLAGSTTQRREKTSYQEGLQTEEEGHG
jgi:hypothetical protein